MRVQATKVMTNAINKYLQEHGEKMHAETERERAEIAHTIAKARGERLSLLGV